MERNAETQDARIAFLEGAVTALTEQLVNRGLMPRNGADEVIERAEYCADLAAERSKGRGEAVAAFLHDE